MYYSTVYLSPLGKITLACDADGKNLVELWLEGQKHYGASLDEPLTENDSVPLFDAAKNWLDRYFAGAEPELAELRWRRAAVNFVRGCGKYYALYLMAKSLLMVLLLKKWRPDCGKKYVRTGGRRRCRA